MRRRWLGGLLGLLLACPGAKPGSGPEVSPDAVESGRSQAVAPSPPPRRALWVLAEGSYRALESRDRIERLVEAARSAGTSDLFVQVYRAGRSWFASSHADDRPHDRARAAVGEDSLRLLVRRAHARGLRVHAWFNVLSLANNRDAPLLRELGSGAVLVDQRGRSLLDYPGGKVPRPDREWLRMGTPGIWLDPTQPEVARALGQLVDDLARAAPDLDGLHLDFIRYPIALPIAPGSRFGVGLDFGYGAASRAAFERESGRSFAPGDAWDDFRRRRVTQLVRHLRQHLPAGWELSAAVLPWADRAYQIGMQDWRRWLEEGLLDFAVAMAYSRDDRQLRYLAHELVGGVGGERTWLGLGAWLFAKAPERLAEQTRIAAAASPSGLAFFSWDALADQPESLRALESGAGGARRAAAR
ncbi:MAG: glycoside hydrolase family 10 protein [Myxococcota bacterium]